MAGEQTHYEVLGVLPTATFAHIKQQFRKLVLTCHPDKVQGRQNEFVRIQTAWSILCNESKRRAYDQELRDLEIVAGTSISNHLEIDIDDMGYDEKASKFTFPCRCGSSFEITEAELDVGDADIECTGCSLRATVLYEIEEPCETSGAKDAENATSEQEAHDVLNIRAQDT